MPQNARDYKEWFYTLLNLGVLQRLKNCDDKKMTGKFVLEVEFNDGGLRSVLVTEQTKIK